MLARKLAEEDIDLAQWLGELAFGRRKARARANAEARRLAEESVEKGAQESSNTAGAVETVGAADAQEPSLRITPHSKVGVAPEQSRNEARQAGALAHLRDEQTFREHETASSVISTSKCSECCCERTFGGPEMTSGMEQFKASRPRRQARFCILSQPSTAFVTSSSGSRKKSTCPVVTASPVASLRKKYSSRSSGDCSREATLSKPPPC